MPEGFLKTVIFLPNPRVLVVPPALLLTSQLLLLPIVERGLRAELSSRESGSMIN